MFDFLSFRFVELRWQTERRQQITKILFPESGYRCPLRLLPTRNRRFQAAPSLCRQREQALTLIFSALNDDQAIPLQHTEISGESCPIQSEVLGQSCCRHRFSQSNSDENCELTRFKT